MFVKSKYLNNDGEPLANFREILSYHQKLRSIGLDQNLCIIIKST
jgi:hypothetical protein